MRSTARIIATTLALFLLAGITSSDSKLTDRQRALHALNRLGFGPRPGDVDRVMKTGVDVVGLISSSILRASRTTPSNRGWRHFRR